VSSHTSAGNKTPISRLQDLVISSGHSVVGSSISVSKPPTTALALKTAQKLHERCVLPDTAVEDFLAAVRKITADSIKSTHESKWMEVS
jgi:hypothetical protein